MFGKNRKRIISMVLALVLLPPVMAMTSTGDNTEKDSAQ